MNKAIVEMIGIGAALTLTVAVLLFIASGAMAANSLSQSANDKTAKTQDTLTNDLCESYDRKDTSGSQIVDLIEKASEYEMRIKVQTGTVLDSDGNTVPAYDYYIYSDDSLTSASDGSQAALISRARKNIPGTRMYTGQTDTNPDTTAVIGITFNMQ